MMELDITFEDSLWRQELEALPHGGTINGVQLLALMEQEDEDALFEAFEILEDKGITLDISQLPVSAAEGEAAVRLHREQQLVQQGTLLESLEQTDPLRIYLQELAGIPVAGDLDVLAQRYAQGEETLGQQLADHSLSRVVELAQQMTGRGVLLLDLIQEASLGLWQGILCYRGGDFALHTDWWIRQYLARAVLLQARAGGLGQKLRQGMEDFRDVDQHLLGQLGRNPTLEEIAEHMHISVQDAQIYEDMLNMARDRKKIDDIREDAPQMQEEEDQAVENTAYFQSRQRIMEMLSALSAQEAQLLTLRFGLEGGMPLSPEETGRKLHLTPEEVVAQEAAALAKLRGQES